MLNLPLFNRFSCTAGRVAAMAVSAVLLLGAVCRARAADTAPGMPQPPSSGAASHPGGNGAALSPDRQQLSALIDSGTLAGLRWPNFSDYIPAVKKFYEAGAYALAWTSNGSPLPQTLAMIGQFRQAQFKGLNPQDYDAPRWEGRLARLAPPTPHPAFADLVQFDVAMTVTSMRFISDLHLGRINPHHFKFNLGAGAGKIDLADFLRNRLLTAADVAMAVASVERQHAGYRRAEAALAHYLGLAEQGDGPPVPMPARSVRPGDSFNGIPQLVRRLHQLGDLDAAGDPAVSGTVYEGVL